MTIPFQIEFPDAWYHVMTRGRRSENIFGNTDGYERFIDLLQEAAEMFTLMVSAFCLMPNHYHILVQPPQGNQPTTQQESSKDLATQHVHAPASTNNLYSYLVPDRKPPISPISSLVSNFNPQNTECIPPVKIIVLIELEEICRFSFRHYLKYRQLISHCP